MKNTPIKNKAPKGFYNTNIILPDGLMLYAKNSLFSGNRKRVLVKINNKTKGGLNV
jgi:hypothetical protein